VEGLNGILSLRYNKFNSKGGNKGSPKNKLDAPNRNCWAFEVLGSWMARLCMWQLSLGMLLFAQGDRAVFRTKLVKWHTGKIIVYESKKAVAVTTHDKDNITTDEDVPNVDLDSNNEASAHDNIVSDEYITDAVDSCSSNDLSTTSDNENSDHSDRYSD
jgi:hypothetical protein